MTNFTKAHKYCKLNNIDPDCWLWFYQDEQAGTTYSVSAFALVVDYFDALDIGFSSEFKG